MMRYVFYGYWKIVDRFFQSNNGITALVCSIVWSLTLDDWNQVRWNQTLNRKPYAKSHRLKKRKQHKSPKENKIIVKISLLGNKGWNPIWQYKAVNGYYPDDEYCSSDRLHAQRSVLKYTALSLSKNTTTIACDGFSSYSSTDFFLSLLNWQVCSTTLRLGNRVQIIIAPLIGFSARSSFLFENST